MSTFWKGKKVLVTGATGFLGSWLTSSLIANGAEVVTLIQDDLPNSHFHMMDLDKEVVMIKGPLNDYQLICRVLNEYEIDSVFHLSSRDEVVEATQPLDYFGTHIKGSWSILEAARKSELVKRIVVASSDRAYGTKRDERCTEEVPLQGTSLASVSDSCIDLITQSYWETYELPVVVARCSELYGGGDLDLNHFIPNMICEALNGNAPVVNKDEKLKLDCLYVMDAVKAFLLLAEKLHQPEIKGQAFNIGSNEALTAVEIGKKVLQLIGEPNLKLASQENVDDMQERIPCLDSSKAETLLDWQKEHTVDQGLMETVAWYRELLTTV